MFSIDKDGIRKVINQRVTTVKPKFAKFTTPITTPKVILKSELDESTTAPPESVIDVITYEPEDYYDPDLWPEIEQKLNRNFTQYFDMT